MKRPASLTIAVVLQWVAAVIALLSGLDLIAAAFEMRGDEVTTQLEGVLLNQGIADVPGKALVTAVFVAGVLLLALAVIRVMVAVYLAQGRAWARIVVTVFVLLNLAGSLAYLFEGYWVRAILGVVVELLVLWLLFNARSSEFIRVRSSAPAAALPTPSG
jgi:hypothetical protein